MKNQESTLKLDDLYNKHNEDYDEFEELIKSLKNSKVITENTAVRILELADEAVETHAAYSYELGRWSLLRLFNPKWWLWTAFGRRAAQKKEEKY